MLCPTRQWLLSWRQSALGIPLPAPAQPLLSLSLRAQVLTRTDKRRHGVFLICRRVTDATRLADLEVLARMAARLAGRDPDEHVRIKLGEVLAFDDVMWRYPDFLARAEAAYGALGGTIPLTGRD